MVNWVRQLTLCKLTQTKVLIVRKLQVVEWNFRVREKIEREDRRRRITLSDLGINIRIW